MAVTGEERSGYVPRAPENERLPEIFGSLFWYINQITNFVQKFREVSEPEVKI